MGKHRWWKKSEDLNGRLDSICEQLHHSVSPGLADTFCSFFLAVWCLWDLILLHGTWVEILWVTSRLNPPPPQILLRVTLLFPGSVEDAHLNDSDPDNQSPKLLFGSDSSPPFPPKLEPPTPLVWAIHSFCVSCYLFEDLSARVTLVNVIQNMWVRVCVSVCMYLRVLHIRKETQKTERNPKEKDQSTYLSFYMVYIYLKM